MTTSSVAWRKLIVQHQRLTQLLEAGDSTRPGWVDDLLDIGAKTVEGPYRAYGNLVLDALKIASGAMGALDSTTAGTAGFGTVRYELAARCPQLAENVHPIIRNASAHYDYQTEGEFVRIRHLPPRTGAAPIIETHTFDDLLTALSNLPSTPWRWRSV